MALAVGARIDALISSTAIRVRFLAAGACWSAALLIALRSRIGERAIVAPLAAWQAAIASGVPGGSAVTVDLSCSGGDVIALSIAAILAYPVPWRRRLLGVACAAAWLASLNAIRIATLVNAAGSPMFAPLHVYVWPGLLIGGATLFVVVWIWTADRAIADRHGAELPRVRAFGIAAPLFIAAYAAATPWLLASDVLQRAAIAVAQVAAALLRAVGADAVTGGSTLVVGQQAFFITPECITTPLMPVYLAWAVAWPRRAIHTALALALFVPAFAALSVARLLTVALPALIGPPLYLTHAFYQLVVGIVLIAAAAEWRARRNGEPGGRRFVYALAAAIASAILLARPYTIGIEWIASALRAVAPHTASTAATPADVQGVTSIMPGYELALTVGLWIAWSSVSRASRVAALALLAVAAQVATLSIVGELRAHASTDVPVMFVRLLSILTPTALVAALAARVPAGARQQT